MQIRSFSVLPLPVILVYKVLFMPCARLAPSFRERFAWYMYDWSNSAFTTSALAMFAPILYSNLFGPSFFSYYVSMSVIGQCLVFIAVSSFADYGSGRKFFFIGFSVAGCACTCLMGNISSSSDKSLAATLLILANICYGASFVFYNAYIPFLAESHEDVMTADAANKLVHQEHQLHSVYFLRCLMSLLQAVKRDVESRISNTGYITGYCGGIIMTLIAVAVAFLNAAESTATQREKDDASNRSGRIVLVIVGIWWFCFSLFTFIRLGSHPGPSLPSMRAYLTLPWTRLFETFRHIRELSHLGRYLLLYFFYSDGYNVIGSVCASISSALVAACTFCPCTMRIAFSF